MRYTDISTWPCSWKTAVRWLLPWYAIKWRSRGESKFVNEIRPNSTNLYRTNIYILNTTNCFRLFFGFISNPDGTNSNIDWSDLNIYQFGENGRVAEELCFLIKIGKFCLNNNNNMFQWFRIESRYIFFFFFLFSYALDKIIHTVQLVCDSQHWYRLEKDVMRCEQIGECLLDDQPGKCLIQSLYSETSLKAKTLCRPLSFLDIN